MPRPIGIDLGTTYTVLATLENGRPTIVPNAEGDLLTPSVVCFTGGALPLVGERARQAAATAAHEAVFSIKRRMGSPYRVKVGERLYTPQEVAAFILHKVKVDAESFLAEPIDQAVITVPAYFNDLQRQATKEAAAVAGLRVMKVINEPTAAALAYGLREEEAHTVLVWDLGGGTFDVSVLELGEGIFEVRAVSGDSSLGGDDWDGRLAQFLQDEYRATCGTSLPNMPLTERKLLDAAEKAKRELSFLPAIKVRLPAGAVETQRCVEVEITRQQLEVFTKDLLERMIAPTEQALADAGLSPTSIDRVILVGGATRMPAVRRLARALFGQEPYRYVKPDETVAMGAAIQAGMLMGLVDKAVLLDVLPLSLGIETQGGLTAKVIQRNTPVPAARSRIFTTAADYQTSMELHVLQGERDLVSENISLGHFELRDIPAALRGTAKVEVTFEVDTDGIVHVSAEELLSEGKMTVKVASTKSLDSNEIFTMAEEAKRLAARDAETRKLIGARIESRNVLDAMQGALSEAGASASDLCAGQMAYAALELRQAMDTGDVDRMKALCQKLRQELAGFSRRTATP